MNTVLLYVVLVTSGAMANVTTTSQILLPKNLCEVAKKTLEGKHLHGVSIIPMCIGVEG